VFARDAFLDGLRQGFDKTDITDLLQDRIHARGFHEKYDPDDIQLRLAQGAEEAEAAYWAEQENAAAAAQISAGDAPSAPEWLRQCAVDSRSRPYPTLQNAMIALRSDPRYAEMFGFDEMLRAPVMRRDGEGKACPSPLRPVTDVDVSAVQEALQK